MSKRHHGSGAVTVLILAGAVAGLTLWLVRRQGEQGAKPTELEGSDVGPDSWLPDDVLDLPIASSAFASNGAAEEEASSDDRLAEIFDRPRS